MPALTFDQLAALGRTNTGNRQIEATLGRAMTPDERAVVDRSRLIRDMAREAKRHKVKENSSDRHTAITAERSKVDRVPCADPARRARLEADPVAWLKHYMSATFTRPFERPHLEIVAGVMRAHETQGRFVVAAERGCGKTVILWGMILYLLFSGRHKLPVCVTWADKALKRALRFWSKALCRNPELAADYPEFCAPFVHAKGVPQRVATTRWRDTEELCGCQLTICEGMVVMPDALGCIGGGTINGSIKGFNHTQDDGTVLRPSIVLLDDVQDRFVAKSPVQVADTVVGIDGDLASIGQSGRDLPMLMAINCEHTGDVAEHYLTSKDWHALRVPCVEAWPSGWDDPKSKCRELWGQWHERFLSGKGDLTFYRKNRKAMTAGMRLSAPSAFKGAQKCPDPLYGAMRMYYKMGHEAFMAQRQQSPVSIESSAILAVSPEAVLSRAVGPPRGRAPDGTLRIVAGADINHGRTSRLGARVTWAVLAFQRHQVATVIAYGRERIDMPTNPTEAQSAAACFAAIEQVRGKVTAMGTDVMFYDARGQWAPRGIAIRYAMQRTPGATIIAAEGWPNEMYRPTHKSAIRVFEGGHECADNVDGVRVRWVAWNADHWGETALRAWLAVPGAPGSCVLYTGDQEHEFAEQVTMKRLVGKLQTSKGVRYDWSDRPGDQDYADAVGMAWAAAAWGGIGTGVAVAAPRKYIETRKCKVQRERL